MIFNYLKVVAFAVTQAVIHHALPLGVEILIEPNELGSLLSPSIYRDINISCMYLADDIAGMFVPSLQVPPYQVPIEEIAGPSDPSMVTPKKGNFKAERKSDFSSGNYISTIKKVRQSEDYPNAKKLVTQMLGEDDDEDVFVHGNKTLYILRCLDTACSSSSLFAGLNHYSSDLINWILRDDFKYDGVEVMKNKVNLLIVCELFLIDLNTIV